jgi:hypothetical protein
MSENDRVLLDGVLAKLRSEAASGLREDEFFEVFLAQQMMWERDLSWDELLAGVLGGGDDGGIDCFYVFCNGILLTTENASTVIRGAVKFELFILQAKRSPGFAEVTIDKLRATLTEVLDFGKDVSKFSGSYNGELLETFSLFRQSFLVNAASFPTAEVHIIYGTRGLEIHPKVARKAEALRSAVAEMFSDSKCDFRFVTPRDLVVMARRQRPTSFDLTANEIISTGSGGLIATVNIMDYYQFIKADNGDLRQSLLESNVRDYEGPGGVVNTSIRATLREGGDEDFWWLNNGVTIVARRAAQFGKRMTLEYPQIVNGLQTTREVWGYCSGEDVTGDDRSILVRIVIPPNDVSRDRIIRATNSQTAIPTVALRATDPVQRQIEDYFSQSGYFYERRKNQHQIPGRPLTRVCSIAYLAESVLAVHLLEPHVGAPRLGGRFLREDREYGRIFSPLTPIEIFLKCFQITKAIEAGIRNNRATASRSGSVGRPVLLIACLASATLQLSASLAEVDQAAIDALDVVGLRDQIRLLEESVRKEGKRGQSNRDEGLKMKINSLYPSIFKSIHAKRR